MTTTINYCATQFDRSEPIIICGELTFDTIHKLHNEVKANALYLYSNIRGRTQGFPVLVLTGAKYALVYQTPLLRPTHPSPLTIPSKTTAPITTIMRYQYTEYLSVFQ